MHYKVSILLFLFVGIFSIPSLSVNRFLKLGVIRCVAAEAGLSKKECEEERTTRLELGEITKEEYNWLVSKSAIPSINGKKQPYGYCVCGCFAPWTQISVMSSGSETLMPISEIMPQYKELEVMSMAPGSKTNNIQKRALKIDFAVTGAEKKPFVIVSTKGGIELSLTTEHPVLLSDGQIAAAKDLQMGQSLVEYTGTPDEIVSIANKKLDIEAMNLMTTGGKDLLSHFIFAENRVVGDIYIQNTAQSELDAVSLRQ